MDRAPDALICAAATQSACHGSINIGIGWVRVLCDERSRSHNLPGLAVAALCHVFREPRLLQRVRTIGRKSLNRRDLVTHCLGD